MTTKSPARAIADLHGGNLLATVDISVPPERVFRALTTEEVTKWWGSAETYRTTSFESDLRVGGSWRSRGVGADGKPFQVRGSYLEIDAPRRLVHTWEPDWDEAPTKVTYLLDATPTGTRVTLRHEGFGARAEACAQHGAGWELVLGWLAGHVVEARPAPVTYFVVRLMPPRSTFMVDMTADERAVMMSHVGYWTELLHAGKAMIFGPVADPAEPHGLGILSARDEGELAAMLAKDPAILSSRGFRHVVTPMINPVTA